MSKELKQTEDTFEKEILDIEWSDAEWGKCYFNASLYVLTDGPDGCWYVEGYVYTPLGRCVQHAWVETDEEILEVSPSIRGCKEYEGLYRASKAELREVFDAEFGLNRASSPAGEPQRFLGQPLYFGGVETSPLER